MTEREQTERTADRIREELLLTLEELDRRRTRATDVKYQVQSHQDLLLAAGAVAVVLAGASVGYATYRRRHRAERLYDRRKRALRRAWEHPDRLATGREEKPFLVDFGQKLVLIFGTALATAIAKRSVQSLVPTRDSPAAMQAHGAFPVPPNERHLYGPR